MVNEKEIIPPVYFLTVPALAAFYCAVNVTVGAFLNFAAVAVFAAVLAAAFFFTLRQFALLKHGKSAWPRAIFLIVCAVIGIICGLLSAGTVHAEQASPESLADRTRVSAVTVSFLSDPAPWGPDFCRVPCTVDSFLYEDGSSFSARGRCALVLPSAMVSSCLPGGLAGRESGPVLFSSGLEATFTGSFTHNRQGTGDIFYATSIVPFSAHWQNGFDFLRAKLRLSLMRILYDWKEAGGFLLALFSANREYLDPALASDFKQTGLSHILALSGMHLSLLALVAIRIGKKIGGKRFSVRLSLFAIVIFVWFAGVAPSLNRSLVMAIFMIALKRLGFKPAILPVLALTAFVQMLLSPSDATSLAFMLSYAALWGIVTFGEYALSVIPSSIRVFPVSDFTASIGATIMTAPVIALSIGVIAPIGIVASCFASPLSSAFLVFGMALVLVSVLVPPLSHVCGAIVTAFYQVTVFPVHLFARIHPLSIRGLPATIFACIFPLLAGFLIMYLAAQCRHRRSIDDSFARL